MNQLKENFDVTPMTITGIHTLEEAEAKRLAWNKRGRKVSSDNTLKPFEMRTYLIKKIKE